MKAGPGGGWRGSAMQVVIAVLLDKFFEAGRVIRDKSVRDQARSLARARARTHARMHGCRQC